MKKLYAILTLIAGIGFAGSAKAQCSVTFTYTANGLTINANATATGVTQAFYGWSWGDTQTTTNQQAASHTFSAAGTYTVCAIVVDAITSCTDSSCQVITVTGTSNVVENQPFKIEAGAYPNPFTGKTSIIFSNTHPSEVEISVYDVLGKKVADLFKDNVGAGEHTVDWSAQNIPAGLYFLQVKAGDITLNKKILKNQ